jgi:hypothetical protein
MLYAGSSIAAPLSLGDVRHNLSTRLRPEVLAPARGLEMEWAGIPRTRTSGVSLVFALASCRDGPQAGQKRKEELAHFAFPIRAAAWRFQSSRAGKFKFSLDWGKIETAAQSH